MGHGVFLQFAPKQCFVWQRKFGCISRFSAQVFSQKKIYPFLIVDVLICFASLSKPNESGILSIKKKNNIIF